MVGSITNATAQDCINPPILACVNSILLCLPNSSSPRCSPSQRHKERETPPSESGQALDTVSGLPQPSDCELRSGFPASRRHPRPRRPDRHSREMPTPQETARTIPSLEFCATRCVPRLQSRTQGCPPDPGRSCLFFPNVSQVRAL